LKIAQGSCALSALPQNVKVERVLRIRFSQDP